MIMKTRKRLKTLYKKNNRAVSNLKKQTTKKYLNFPSKY